MWGLKHTRVGTKTRVVSTRALGWRTCSTGDVGVCVCVFTCMWSSQRRGLRCPGAHLLMVPTLESGVHVLFAASFGAVPPYFSLCSPTFGRVQNSRSIQLVHTAARAGDSVDNARTPLVATVYVASGGRTPPRVMSSRARLASAWPAASLAKCQRCADDVACLGV